MNRKVISAVVLALTVGFTPAVFAGHKDNKAKDAKSSQISKSSDRGSAWHGKDWKAGQTTGAKSGSTARAVPSQSSASRPAGASSRPASDNRYISTGQHSGYDYFGAHYGSHPAGAMRRSASTQPAGVLGYVPPNNAQNPFIYRRGG